MARMILVVVLALTAAGGVFAQETPPADATAPAEAETTATTTATAEGTDTAEPTTTPTTAWEIRNQFSRLLHAHTDALPTLLVLDPTLLANDEFLEGYPEVARFVAAHPEIIRNARFYLGDFEYRRNQVDAVGDVLEGLTILGTVALIAFAFTWLIRTIIEQRRWNRLSRTQAEVHNKILDRFASSEDLLQYVKSPAGTKFLESAPIPVRTEQATTPGAPMTRIMWSVQIGIIVAVAGLGTLLSSIALEGEDAQALFILGAIAFCVGAGFVASAVVSLLLSRRLGLWQPTGTAPANVVDSSGVTR